METVLKVIEIILTITIVIALMLNQTFIALSGLMLYFVMCYFLVEYCNEDEEWQNLSETKNQ